MRPAAVLSVLVNAQGVAATNAKLRSVQGNLGGAAAAGQAMGNRIAAGAKVATVGAVAAAAALYKVGEEFDDATDTIRVKTGATGKDLKRLQRDFKAVVKDVPTDFGTAGDAIADVHRRLDLTGRPLRQRTKQFLELSRITKTDVGENIKEVTRAFGDWDVATNKQGRTLDYFFRASQASGASVADLAKQVVQFGAPLRQVGFSLEQSVAMFAQFEKAGVNTSTMMPGLRMALKGFLAEGKDPAKALAKAFADIEAGTMSSSAALKIFGQRAGADMIEAVRQGRFDLDKLTASLARGDDTIIKAGRDTQDFAEKWQMFRNKALVALEPVATRVFALVGDKAEEAFAIVNNPRLTAGQKLSQLTHMVTEALGEATREAAKWGPRIASAAATGFLTWWTDANPLMKVLATAAIIRMIGGPGALKATGLLIGRMLGGGIAGGMATTMGGGGAGAAAGGAGGAIGGLRGRLMAVAKGVGLAGVGIVLADGLMKEMGRRAQEKSPDFVEAVRARAEGGKLFGFDTAKLPGGEGAHLHEDERTARQILPLLDQMVAKRALLRQADINEIAANAHKLDLNKQQSAQLSRAIDLAQVGRDLGIKVSLDMDLGKLQQLDRQMGQLRNGFYTSTGDIAKVSRRNMGIVANVLGSKTAEGRKAAAMNLRATAEAYHVQMVRSGNETKRGMARVTRLIREADLTSPTRARARDFGREWGRGLDTSKEVTRRGVVEMIREARKMPAPMRKVALEAWNAQITAAQRSGKITKTEAQNMRSKVGAAFQGIELASKRKSKGGADAVIRNTERMVNTTGRGFSILRDNTNAALGPFGVREMSFQVKKFSADKKQQGGFIVPGTGAGDKFATTVPNGSFVLNREATSAFGLQRGGMSPVLLEPKERVFYPDEVARIGRSKLAAMNATVPRFQSGGPVGYPGVTGDTDFMPALGFALSKMARSTGSPIFVQDGGRTMAEQEHLYGLYQAGIGNLAAVPSPNAPHIAGRAADITPGRERFGGVAGKFGLGFTVPSESWHIELLNAIGGAHGAAAMQIPKLAKMVMSGSEGPLLDLGQHALDKVHRAAQKYIREQAGEGGSGPWEGVMAQISKARGWVLGHWRELVDRESGGDPQAVNPSSGAAGLAQALPPSKYPPGAWPYTGPASAVKQIQWMANYISGRYGTPTAALGFHDAHNWYQQGGTVGYVGDSLGVGTLDAGLKAKLGGKINLKHNAAESRFSSTGVDVLKAMLTKQMDAVVFDLGTNDGSAGLLGSSIGRVKGMIGKRPLVMSTMLGPDAAKKNDKVRNATEFVAPWASAAGQYVGGDPQGIHPNGAGYGRRATMVADAVKAALRSIQAKKGDKPGKPGAAPAGTPFEQSVDKAMGIARKNPTRKNRRKQRKAIRRALKIIAGLGLDDRQEELKRLSDSADKYAEYASNAQTLNVTDAAGNEIPGMFAGHGENHWLNAQLGALLNLRNRLLGAEQHIQGEKPKAERLLGDAKGRLRNVQGALEKGRKRKAKLEDDMRDLERHLKGLEKKPKVNKAAITETKGKIKAIKGDLGDLDKKQKQRGRVRDLLGGENGVVSRIEKRRAALNTLHGNILGDGGDGGWKGLKVVQGIDGPMEVMHRLPPAGVLGGEILTAQQSLAELGAKPDVSANSPAVDTERVQFLEQALREANQRVLVADSQFATIRNFRLSGFAGYFAGGGTIGAGQWGIAGETGEAEIVRGPATVFSPAESAAMFAASNTSGEREIRVVIEDRRTVVYDGDEMVDETVNEALRGLARRAATRTPGQAGKL
jgi:phage-related minor tail protein